MTPLTGRIVTWDRGRGYGYVDDGKRRVFLHIREFAERHKAPEVGDVIVFTMGTDAHGRSCARQAVHQNDGDRIRRGDIFVLGILLLAPGIAAWRVVDEKGIWFLVIWTVVISGLTYGCYAYDKHCSRDGRWRVPENCLHVFEFVGGWPGAFLAQCRLRHKCSKSRYQVAFWLIVAVHQFVAIDYLRGWEAARAAIHAIHRAQH